LILVSIRRGFRASDDLKKKKKKEKKRKEKEEKKKEEEEEEEEEEEAVICPSKSHTSNNPTFQIKSSLDLMCRSCVFKQA
jgi:CO dehydrogenase/acetyl-CoA synthase beta subunit